MAKLLDGTRVYGSLTVDSNLTISGANSTVSLNIAAGDIFLTNSSSRIVVGDSTSNLTFSNTSITFADGSIQSTAVTTGLFYAISAGMAMT